MRLIYAIDQWAFIAAVLGYGARYLNRGGPWLRYLTLGVFPFYIVHQTVIVVAAHNLAAWKLPQPLEAGLVKEACGAAFQTVTPGIRFADSAADDQARVMTPEKARLGGSDYIVVGRPITQAADPVAAYRRCVKEFLGE